MIEAEHLRKGFGDKLLIDDLTFKLPPGGIVGVIGPNGAGKTTLFRMIIGAGAARRGQAAHGRDRRRSPTSTRSRDALDGETARCARRSPTARTSCDWAARTVNARATSSRFNFRGADQQKQVGDLSGGERNRVHLAKLLRRGGNLLLLDEPTNDLDVDTLRALEEALLDFAGCAVVISHDRWFLDRIATHILAFEGDSQVVWFEGNYQDYEADRKARLGDRRRPAAPHQVSADWRTAEPRARPAPCLQLPPATDRPAPKAGAARSCVHPSLPVRSGNVRLALAPALIQAKASCPRPAGHLAQKGHPAAGARISGKRAAQAQPIRRPRAPCEGHAMHRTQVSTARRLGRALLGLALAAALTSPALANYGYRFTYQGELQQGGLPLNGTANLEFKLFTLPAAGIQVGNTVTANAYPVSNGRFTIDLDFTNGGTIPGVYDGEARYLEISVNATVLTPRERLAPTPHAIMAEMLALPVAQQTTAPMAINIVSTSQVGQERVIRAETQSNAIGAIAIMGEANNNNGNENVGVYGVSNSSNGFGVTGVNTSLVGNCTGVYGQNYSDAGIGVFGQNSSATGVTFGVRGKVASPTGWAGYFEGRSWFQTKVGIRTVGDPQAMLEIQSADAATGLALKVNDELYVDHTNNFVGVNRGNRIGSEWFGVRAPVVGNLYGGMYMETTSATGKPFYGYALNGAFQGWTYYDGATDLWHLYMGGDRLTVSKTTGNVGVKRTPTTNDLEVEGSASKTTAGSWLANSDARIKTNVQTVGNALATLDQVRLVSFEYTDDYKQAHPAIESRRYLNVIAQEFQKVFPDDVKGSGEKLADGSEILQVDTYPLTIYSAAAIQELHAQLQLKDAELSQLRDRLARVEALVAAIAPSGEGVQAASTVPGSSPIVPAVAGTR